MGEVDERLGLKVGVRGGRGIGGVDGRTDELVELVASFGDRGGEESGKDDEGAGLGAASAKYDGVVEVRGGCRKRGVSE